MIGGRGVRPLYAFEDMLQAQQLWRKEYGRRGDRRKFCVIDVPRQYEIFD